MDSSLQHAHRATSHPLLSSIPRPDEQEHQWKSRADRRLLRAQKSLNTDHGLPTREQSLSTTHFGGSRLNQGADSNPGGFGGFPRPSGFTFAYSPDAPQGERVSEVELADGSAVEAEGTYTLAITNYVAINGGDGVTALQDAPVLVSPEEGIADNQALINHVTALETVTQQAPRTEVLGAGS